MFERPKQATCAGCGTPIMFVWAEPCRHLVLDVEPHPAGDIGLTQLRGAWRAQTLTTAEQHAYRRRRLVSHLAVCTYTSPTTGSDSYAENMRSQ